MIKCLYCERGEFEIGKGSEEHVILSSLGGKKASKNICCQKCNNELGDEIDKVLSEEFSFASNFINIKTGRNKTAKTIKNAGVMNGQEFELKPGGIPHFSKVKFDKTVNENTIEASFSARNPEEALNLLEQFAKSHGKTLDDIQNSNVKIISDYDIPQVSGTLNLGGELFFRSVAKMMLTYLATLCNYARLRDGSFNNFIDYITGKNKEGVKLSFDCNTEFPNCNIDADIYHQIFIWADPKSNIVFCGLKLFRFISFSAVLTNCWCGGEIKKSHVIDPINSIASDHDVEFDSTDVEQLVNNMGYDNAQFEKAINDLMSIVCRIQHRTATDNTIEDAITNAFVNQDFQDVTFENMNDFIDTIINQFIAQKIKRVVTQELTIEQLKKLRQQDNK